MFLKKNSIYIFFLCFRHIFLYKLSNLNNSYFNHNKEFFIMIKIWVIISFSKLTQLPIIDLISIKNYNLLRFLEFFTLKSTLNANFKSNFFCCSKPKSIVSFNNFKLKIHINLFFLTNSYLDYFRKFKYNEYLRKNDLNHFFVSTHSKDSFIANFVHNRFLIFFSSTTNFQNLVYSFDRSFFDLNIFLNSGLSNQKFALYFFKYLKKYIRIYFLVGSYNLYFHFKGLMRFYSSFRMFNLGSIPNLNKKWRINTFTLFYKTFYLEYSLKNHMYLSMRFPLFLCLDSIFINPIRQFLVLDYFSNLYHYIYYLFKFKNPKNRMDFLWRKTFVVFFRALINFNNFNFIDMDHPLVICNFKSSLDYLTWSIFNGSFNQVNWHEFTISLNIKKVSNSLDSFFLYNFNISLFIFIKFFNINYNNMYFFLIRFFKDITFKYLYLLNHELNKEVVVNNYYPKLFLKNKEYKFYHSKYIYSTKLLKFDQYYKYNLNLYNE